MNRVTFRKLQGNEIVKVNNTHRGSTVGRQGQIKKINKLSGLVQVEFQGIKTPTNYHYNRLDVIEDKANEETKEEPIIIKKIETIAEENDLEKDLLDASTTYSEALDEESKTEAPEVEEKDETSTSTEADS